MKNFKTYSVRSCYWHVNIEVEDFYENPHAEACTRAIELLIKSKKEFQIGPVILCKYIDEKYDKVFNSCKILQNGGYWKLSKEIRNEFLKETGIDLCDESFSSKK